MRLIHWPSRANVAPQKMFVWRRLEGCALDDFPELERLLVVVVVRRREKSAESAAFLLRKSLDEAE